MSEDLIQATAETDKPSGDHLGSEFEAKARELVEAWDGEAEIDPGTMVSAIATALAEAYGEGLVQAQQKPGEPQCDHPDAREQKYEALGKVAAQNRRENFHSERKMEARIAELEKALERARRELDMAGDQIRTDGWWRHADDIAITIQVIDAVLSQGDRTDFFHDGRLLETNLVQVVSETTVPLCDHPLVRRLMDWFSDPANGAFERVDFEAFMLDEGTTIYWKDVPCDHPNATTIAALEEADRGGLQKFETVTDLMADLNSDDSAPQKPQDGS